MYPISIFAILKAFLLAYVFHMVLPNYGTAFPQHQYWNTDTSKITYQYISQTTNYFANEGGIFFGKNIAQKNSKFNST